MPQRPPCFGKHLTAAVGDILVAAHLPRPEGGVAALQYDSRRVNPGDVFIAIPGRQTDGHRYIPEAIAAGAVGVVLERAAWFHWIREHAPTVNVWQVRSARQAAARLTRWRYAHVLRDLTVFAVTGTKGKTTVTHWLQHTLRSAGIPCARVGTLGMDPDFGIWTGLTTPEAPDLGAYAEQLHTHAVRHLVMEASSIGLDQYRVDGLWVTIAGFLNLGRDHLDYHGTIEAYFAAKARLFDHAYWHTRAAVFHTGDAHGARLAQERRASADVAVWTFGICERPRPDCPHRVHIGVTHLDLTGSRGWILTPEMNEPVAWAIALSGMFNVINFGMVWTMLAAHFGVERACAWLPHLASFHGAPGRMERITLPNDRTVIIDYAHTPESLAAVLAHLKPYVRRRLIVLFGCGGERDAGKRPLMGRAAAEWADWIVLTDDNPRHEDPERILTDILRGIHAVPSPPPTTVIRDRQRAVWHVLEQMQPGDCVLIAGKGAETYQIYGDTQIPYSDRATVETWVQRHVVSA